MPTIGIGCCLSPLIVSRITGSRVSFCLRKGDQLYGRYWGSFKILNVYILMLAITRRLNGRSLKASKLLTPVLVDATKNVAAFQLITVCTLL